MLLRPRQCSGYLHSFRRSSRNAYRAFATERRLPPGFYVASETAFDSRNPTHDPLSPFTPNAIDNTCRYQSLQDHQPPDERQLRLGKTIRVLHEHLPTLLQSPLPQEILSPQITLRLFPSTHPHLPSVSGRLAYVAALWTSPVAWGRIPVISNVKLIIESERMFKNGGPGGERLIVRWRTCSGSSDGGDEAGTADRNLFDKIWSRIPGQNDGGTSAKPKQGPDTEALAWRIRSHSQRQASTNASGTFVGLFIFEFDELGRLHTHTIEHAEEGGNWEKTTSKVISVTDWLLGRAWGRKNEELGLALGYADSNTKMARHPIDVIRAGKGSN